MTTILLSAGIIIAFAIMFWLDRRQGPEPTAAIVHLFDILQNLNWDMNEDDIRTTFSEFTNTKPTVLNKRTMLSHKKNIEGQEIYTTFSLPNENSGKVNKAEIRLSRVNNKDIDLLFSTVSRQYGQPDQNDSLYEGSVKWVTEAGNLTLENTAPEEYVLTIKEEEIEPNRIILD